MSKKIIFSILLLAILLFSFPKPASAFIGTGIFDFFDTALSGIEEKAGPIAKKIVAFFFTYIVGIIALSFSVMLLEKAVNPDLISLQGNSLVEPGWQFTVGVANMFIILILLYIAFSFILKIENQQMKKALPRLIMVAILLNFSLLFVGMLVDVGSITINTFFAGEEGLPSLITERLMDSMNSAAIALGAWIALLAGLFMIPFVAPFAQLGLVTTVVTLGVWGPTMVSMIFQLVSAFIISSIFLIYAILFVARAFIIQLLAIIAPLAFLALILPQTKKYWDKWLHVLLEWVFLGVSLFFFMILGFRTLHEIAPKEGSIIWYNNFEGILYYIFLTLYLIVALFFSKKAMPTFAQAVIDQATGLGKMAIGRGLIPLGGAAKERLQQFAASQKKREGESDAAKARGEKVKISPLKGVAMGTGKWARRGIEFGHRVAGTSLKESLLKDIEKGEKEADAIKDPDLLLAKTKNIIRSKRNPYIAAGYLTKGIEKGKEWKKILQKDIDKEEFTELASRTKQIGAKKQADTITRGFIHKLGDKERESTLQRIGYESYEKLSNNDKKEWKAKKYETITDYIVGEARGDDIKDFGRGFWNAPEMTGAIQKFWGGPQLAKAADEFGRDFVDNYVEKAKDKEKVHPGWFAKNNPRAIRYIKNTPAQDLGYDSGVFKETPTAPKTRVVLPEEKEFKETEKEMRKRLEK